tara:strand:+ start:141 stop:722 length:582 start_codon:yes stop_codon:yes gene_type:complete
MYTQTNAGELNTYLCDIIFGDKDADVKLVDSWGQTYKTASTYMRACGLEMLRRSIRAFLDGKVQHHSYVCASNHTGLMVADSHLLDALNLIAANTSNTVCYRQVLHAVRNNVLKFSTTRAFVPRQSRKVNVRPLLGVSSKQDNKLTIQAEAQEQPLGEMLVDASMSIEEHVAPPATSDSPGKNRARGKRRRKA